ncbi:unnamed protein product, partial [Heterosigma akashiwo]
VPTSCNWFQGSPVQRFLFRGRGHGIPWWRSARGHRGPPNEKAPHLLDHQAPPQQAREGAAERVR